MDRVESDSPCVDSTRDAGLPSLLRHVMGLAGVAYAIPGEGVVGGEFDVTADLDESGGVVGVDHEETDLRVRHEIATLLSFECRVEPGEAVVDVDPHQAGLRVSVVAHCRQHTADRSGQQVEMRGGNRNTPGICEAGHEGCGDSAASMAVTWMGRIRHMMGISVSAKLAGMAPP